MGNSTTPGRRPRHGLGPRRASGPVCCDECGTIHGAHHCPECGNPIDWAMVGTLRTEVTTGAGDRWRVTAERDPDSRGWVPVEREHVEGGTVFGESGTVWESRP